MQEKNSRITMQIYKKYILQNSNTNMKNYLINFKLSFEWVYISGEKIKKHYVFFLLFLNASLLNVGMVDKIRVSNTISDSNGPDKSFLFGRKYT